MGVTIPDYLLATSFNGYSEDFYINTKLLYKSLNETSSLVNSEGPEKSPDTFPSTEYLAFDHNLYETLICRRLRNKYKTYR